MYRIAYKDEGFKDCNGYPWLFPGADTLENTYRYAKELQTKGMSSITIFEDVEDRDSEDIGISWDFVEKHMVERVN